MVKRVQAENSGLAIVYPVDRIKEVVHLDWNRHREGVINAFDHILVKILEMDKG